MFCKTYLLSPFGGRDVQIYILKSSQGMGAYKVAGFGDKRALFGVCLYIYVYSICERRVFLSCKPPKRIISVT